MEATDVLRQQHREIEQLFKRVTGGNGSAHASRAALEELIGTLQVHSRLEETIFYPAVRQLDTKKAEEQILESYEEHGIVDFLLMQLPSSDRRDERFQARLRVLQSLVEEHVQEEEDQVFKLAERLGDAERERLAAALRDEVEEIAEVNDLIDTAVRATKRTESWAGRLLDAGFAMPRQAVSALAPSRLLRLDQRQIWAARIATAVPRFVVDSLHRAVARPSAHRAA